MDSDRTSEKRNALLAYMETLRKEIRANEETIAQLQDKKRTFLHFPIDSSDSDDDLLDVCQRKQGPSMSELSSQEEHLRTRLQATEELTGVQVVQSEVNVLTDAPDLDDGAPGPLERGVWREVTAECRAEALRFTINFCTHQPDRKFAPLAYHNLRVEPVKEIHATELEHSILRALTRPSDAVQVIKSYATACRSRRDTVTRIAELYAGYVTLEKLPKGGFALKCLDSLELTWVLENKWSSIVPFYHKLDFEVTNMDDTYIDRILPAHKQIQDPTIDTEERTNLLSKIIKICIEGKAAMETSEDESTDHNIAQDNRKRSDKHANDQLVSKERAKKQTEKQTDIATLVSEAANGNFNKKGKRPFDVDNGSRKRLKNDEHNEINTKKNYEPKGNTKKNVESKGITKKNYEHKDNTKKNVEHIENTKKNDEPKGRTKKSYEDKESTNKNDEAKGNTQINDEAKSNTKKNDESKGNTKKTGEHKETTKKNVDINKEIQSKDTVKHLEKVRDRNVKLSEKDSAKRKDVNKGRKVLDENAKELNNKTSKNTKDLKKVQDSTKSSGNTAINKMVNTVTNNKVTDKKDKENVIQKTKTAHKHVIQKDAGKECPNNNNIAKNKKDEALNHVFKKPKPIENKSDLIKKDKVLGKHKENHTKNNAKMNRIAETRMPEMKRARGTENMLKPNAGAKSLAKISKIPQRMTSLNDKFRNPLRMSPRFVKNSVPKSKTMFMAKK